jgi:hypothetical protein
VPAHTSGYFPIIGLVTDDYGWPWGENKPSRRARTLVAAVIATLAAYLIYNGYQSAPPGWHTDFALSWFGARSLLQHQDPYPLVGIGRAFGYQDPLVYPPTAFVAVIPLAPFPEYLASTFFVWISTALLVYGMTARSWHLLPIIPSFSFLVNVRTSQWTILTTAMLFLPALAFFSLTKPQFAVPVVVSAKGKESWYAAAVGSVALIGISLVLLPGWPLEWLNQVRHHTGNMHAPLTRPLGFLIPLVLLRWRRPEAWFVFLLAAMPQTWDYYNTLPLLALAATYREACALSLVSSIGGFVWIWIGRSVAANWTELTLYGPAAIVLFAYLPVVYAILRRPNEGEGPLWLKWMLARQMKPAPIQHRKG